MAKATDYTMLSKLAFADPDKKSPIHDMAIQFLSTPKCREFIWKHCFHDYEKHFPSPMKEEHFQVRSEYPLSKGADQYKTTIGFLDLMITAVVQRECVLVVEVKITETSVGDAIRQINLYRTHIRNPHGHKDYRFALVTKFDVTPADLLSLENERIYWVRLSKGFEQWRAKQQELGAAEPHLAL
jgi:hypothetical protein